MDPGFKLLMNVYKGLMLNFIDIILSESFIWYSSDVTLRSRASNLLALSSHLLELV